MERYRRGQSNLRTCPQGGRHFVCGEGVRIDLQRAGAREDEELEPTS
jgi:hypothetical protein